jgi:hypothetical protein
MQACPVSAGLGAQLKMPARHAPIAQHQAPSIQHPASSTVPIFKTAGGLGNDRAFPRPPGARGARGRRGVRGAVCGALRVLGGVDRAQRRPDAARAGESDAL